jgi:site-specific DNA-cytosine methylase
MPTPSLNSAALRQLEEKGFTAGMIQALPDSSVVHYNKIYQEQTGSYDTPPPTAPAANQRATVAERLPLVGTAAAEQAFIASEFGVSPERGQRAQTAVEDFTDIQRTTGGTAAPILTRLQEPFSSTQFAQEVTGTARGEIPAEGLTGLIGALAPQTIQTRQQLAESRRQQMNANRAALLQMRMLTPDATDEEIVSSTTYQNLSRDILTGKRDPRSLAGLDPSLTRSSPLQTEARRIGAELLTPRESPLGGIIEAPAMYAGRMLSTPVEVAVGAGEAALTDRTLTEAIPQRIQRGESTTGAGRDIGRAAAEATGIESLETVGAGLGLAAEFIVSPIPGLGIAKGAARTIPTAARAAAAGGLRAGADVAATRVIGSVMPSYALRRTAGNTQLTEAIERASRYSRAYSHITQPHLQTASSQALKRDITQRLTAAGVTDADAATDNLIKQLAEIDGPPTDAQTQVIARQLGQRLVNPTAETVRVTPTTAAPADIAELIAQDYTSTTAGRLAETIRSNPQQYIKERPGRRGPTVDIEAAARDAGLTDAELIDYLQAGARRRYDVSEADLITPAAGPARLATMFSGMGTVEAGLTAGTARSVDAVEYIPEILEQFNRVHGTGYVPRSVIDIDVADVAAADPEVFHASPVCKNFSAAKRGVDNADELDRLSAEKVAEVIREVRPPIVTVENVPDYADTALFKLITDQLTASGYRWSADIVEAAEYGAAQERRRLVLRAVRDDIGELPPAPEKTGGADWYATIEDLIADAPDMRGTRKPTPAAPDVPTILRNAPAWERRRLMAMAERGTIDLNRPILSMGGSTSRTNVSARNAGQPGPTLKSSPKETPRIYLPDGTAKRLTPRMMARLTGLADSVPVPDTGTIANQARKAKTMLGNGIEGHVTRQWIEPLYSVLNASKEATPTPARQLIEASVQRDLKGMSLPRYNAAAIGALDNYALANGAEDLTAIQAADPATGDALRRALTPRELRPGKLRTMINEALTGSDAAAMTPGLEKLIDDTGRELGTMGDDLLRATRARERAEGISRPEAFIAEVISQGYGGNTRRASREAMYGMYGAFDSIGQAIYSAKSTRFMEKPPEIIREEISEILTGLAAYSGDDALLIELRETLSTMSTSAEAYGLGALQLPRILSGTSPSNLAARLNLDSAGSKYSKKPPLFSETTGLDLIGLTYSQARTGRILTEALTPSKLRAAGISYDPQNPAILLNDTAAAMDGNAQDAATLYHAVLAEMTGTSAVRLNLLDVDTASRIRTTLESTENGRALLQRYDDAELTELLLSTGHRLAPFQNAARPRFDELKTFIQQTLADRIQPIAQLEAAGVSDAGRRIQRLLNLEGVSDMLSRVSKPEEQRLLRLTGELIDIYDLARTGDAAGLAGKANTRTAGRIIQAATSAAVHGGLSLIDANSPVSRWVKGGLLAGRFLPNLVYMGMNVLTAPAIVYSTIGPTAAAAAVGRMAAAPVTTAIAGATGIEAANRLSRLSPTIAALNAFYGYGDPLRIVLTTPAGEVYRAADIAELIPRITTQAQAELAESLASDFRTYSGIAERAVTRGQPAARISELSQSRGRRAVRAYTGLDPATGEVGQNIFNEMADAQDLTFRVGVMIDAIKEGRPVDEALTLAQDALFDYGRMTELERNLIAKRIWFWTFRRENLRATLISLVENPERIRATYQATGFFSGYDDQPGPAHADYMTNRPFMRLFEDPEMQRRYATYGPSAPLIDGLAELIDYAAAGALLIDGMLYSAMGYEAIPGQLRTGTTAAARTSEAATNILTAAGTAAVEERINPFISGFMEIGLGIQGNEKGEQLTDRLDPRFLAYMDLNPDSAEIFGIAIDIEPIPYADEIPSNGTYQGRQWRVKADKGNLRRWSAIRHAMILGGFERTIRDYAPIYHRAVKEDGGFGAMSLEPMVTGGEAPAELDLFFKSLGVVSPVNVLTLEERRRRNINAMSQELRAAGLTERSTPAEPMKTLE